MNFPKNFLKAVSLTTFIPLFLAVLAVINIAVSLFPLRFDLTYGQQYTLTEATKKILKGLSDIVNIKVYVSSSLPPDALAIKQEAEDLLSEYQASSKGKLQLKFIDPRSEEAQQEALNLGIPPLQFSTVQKEKYEVSQGFFGLAVLFADRREIIPVINSQNLEYDLTSAIWKVKREEIPEVALANGHQELDEVGQFALGRQLLQKEYTVSDYNFSQGEPIPKDVKTVIIAKPLKEFTVYDQYLLDQFLMNGGHLLFLLDGIEVTDSLKTETAKHDLFSLLNSYGLKLNQDLVLDALNEVANFSSGYTTFFVPYPFWPKIEKSGFNQENLATSKLETAVFPWVSSIEVRQSVSGGQKTVELIKTSSRSWVQAKDFNLSPQQRFDLSGVELKPHLVAAAVAGKIESHFKGKETPQDKKGKKVSGEPVEETNEGQLILVADGDFVGDQFLRNNQADAALFLNLVDYLSQSSDLFTIRSKGIINRPLRQIPDEQKVTLKYINIFGPPILAALFGFGRAYFRNRRRYTLG